MQRPELFGTEITKSVPHKTAPSCYVRTQQSPEILLCWFLDPANALMQTHLKARRGWLGKHTLPTIGINALSKNPGAARWNPPRGWVGGE